MAQLGASVLETPGIENTINRQDSWEPDLESAAPEPLGNQRAALQKWRKTSSSEGRVFTWRALLQVIVEVQ